MKAISLYRVVFLGVLVFLPWAWGQAQSGRASSSAAPTAAPSGALPLPPGLQVKRLILKDGSYQPVSKIEVHGDRVRYLSGERFEWEEVPCSLIDWKATEQYAREGGDAGRRNAEATEIDAEEQAELKKEEEKSPLVAPGLHLPATGGVFLLDAYQNESQLNELAQNGGEIKRNRGSNILRATINPLSSQKQTIELTGLHARVQSHVGNPSIFVSVDQDDSSSSAAQGAPAANASSEKAKNKDKDVSGKDKGSDPNHFRIVRMELVPKKNARVIGNIKIAVYGKASEEEKFVPATVQVVSGPWLKVTPTAPLEPGEYALVEILEKNQMNLFVWDFGVDPKAPENPGTWRPGNK